MSFFDVATEAHHKGGLSAREKEAMQMLANGMGRARVRIVLAKLPSDRQAQRYTQVAALELMAEPLSTEELDDIALISTGPDEDGFSD